MGTAPVTDGQPGLPAAVRSVIDVVLSADGDVSRHCFGDDRLGIVYRAYLVLQFLDPPARHGAHPSGIPGSPAAKVLSGYRLTGAGSSGWVQLYEHMCGVVAAAETIATRMALGTAILRDVKTGALLHDAAKRRDVERHGALASSLGNTDSSLACAMREAGYGARAIEAALNTGRADRAFASDAARRQSIEAKGPAAAIVGLADARTVGARFVSLPEALAGYLRRKRDSESQEFFIRHWAPYYEAVEEYLAALSPGLDLSMTREVLYRETVFPAVFGPSPSRAIRRCFGYQP